MKWYNVDKIWNMGYRFNIINGIMDDGKTFGFKLKMLEVFKKTGNRFIWLMNTKVALEEELAKFKTDLENYDDDWYNFKIEKIPKTDKWVGKYDSEIVCYFQALSSTSKTARDSKVKYIIFDEFNYGDTRVWNYQAQNFLALLSRNMRIDKIFMIGNATSLNIPLLVMFNIFHIEKEWTEFKIGKFKGIFHNFKRPEREIDNKYKDSISYAIMKKTEYADHAFKNKYLLDNYDNVDKNRWKGETKYIFELNNKELIELRDCYPNIYICLYKGKEKPKFALSRKLAKDNVIYDSMIPDRLAHKIVRGRVFYESVMIKQEIHNLVGGFFYW